MSRMTPEQLDNQADALELINSEITASLARQVGPGQRLTPKPCSSSDTSALPRHSSPPATSSHSRRFAYAAYGLCVATGIWADSVHIHQDVAEPRHSSGPARQTTHDKHAYWRT